MVWADKYGRPRGCSGLVSWKIRQAFVHILADHLEIIKHQDIGDPMEN